MSKASCLKHQTIDKVGQLFGRDLVSEDNQLKKSLNHDKCHLSRHDCDVKKWQTIRTPTLLCCFIFWMRNNIKSGPYIIDRWAICWLYISSPDCLWKLNHALEVGRLYRSSDASLRVMTEVSDNKLSRIVGLRVNIQRDRWQSGKPIQQSRSHTPRTQFFVLLLTTSFLAVRPGTPASQFIRDKPTLTLNKPVVDVARDAQCCVHTRPQLVWKTNCSVYQLSIHSRAVRHWLYHRERVLIS